MLKETSDTPDETEFNCFAWFGGLSLEQARKMKQSHTDLRARYVNDIYDHMHTSVNAPSLTDIALGAAVNRKLADWSKAQVDPFLCAPVEDILKLTGIFECAALSEQLVWFASHGDLLCIFELAMVTGQAPHVFLNVSLLIFWLLTCFRNEGFRNHDS